MLSILTEAAVGSFNSVKQITFIVIPIMVVMEILKDIGIIDKIARLFSPIVKIYGMKKEVGFPLVVGIVLGLSYGAGIIMQAAEDYKISRRDLYLLTYFLSTAHAIFEDTAVFMVFGVNGPVLLITRFTAAAIFTYIASRWMKSDTPFLEYEVTN